MPKAPHVPQPGIWCPAVTFINPETDELDLDAQKKYFRYLAGTGLRGLVLQGSNSEAFLLTRDERKQLVAAAREAVGPDFPLMVGAGAHSTKQTLELIQDAANLGADYALVLPAAYYGKATTVPVVKRFFSEVAERSPLPIVIYNFPGVCNGVDLDSETMVDIYKDSASKSSTSTSNVVGVKLTCASVGKITRLAASFPAPSSKFAVFGGQADFLVGGLAAGSAGCIAAFANAFPKTTVRIFQLYHEGRLQEAMELHRKAALAESPIKAGITGTKYATAVYSAQLAGIENAEEKLIPRSPYQEAGEPVKKAIRENMAEVGEIEKTL